MTHLGPDNRTDEQIQKELWGRLFSDPMPPPESLRDAYFQSDRRTRERFEAEEIAKPRDSGNRYPILNQLEDEVGLKLREIMHSYRRAVPPNDFGTLEQFLEWHATGDPVVIDRHSDPAMLGGLVGITADRPWRNNLLEDDAVIANWLASERDQSRAQCEWRGPDCLHYCRDHLIFSRFAFLLAVPTCGDNANGCLGWLLRGAPRDRPLPRSSGGLPLGFVG